ncbi:hypothetical protein ACFXPI_02380 [Streptomyces sp. NPDC059104]|uniref:hypothetical protein n=1 Tax=Streptomyces sp. NPDC059104 TaxID=3346729 RepID=UPI0036BC492E
MSVHVVGHGTFAGPDTFVPPGMAVTVYAREDEKLSIGVAMEIVSRDGASAEGRRVYETPEPSGTPARIHNFTLKALEPHELQMIASAASSKAEVHYVGGSPRLPATIRLCEGDADTCRDGVHRCAGLLGSALVPTPADLRLVCCLVPEGLEGASAMTATLRDDAQDAAEQRIAGADATARQLLAELRDPRSRDAALARLRRLERSSPAAAARLMAYKALGSELALEDARAMRPVCSPGTFMNYLAGLSAEQRTHIQEHLEPADGDASPPQDFLARFPTDALDERYRKWKALSDTEREALGAECPLVARWARQEAALLRYFEQCARGYQPRDAVSAICYEHADLDEQQQIEVEESLPYRACKDAVRQYFATVEPEEKIAAWGGMTTRQHELIRFLVEGTPEDWQRAARPPAPRHVPAAEPSPGIDSDGASDGESDDGALPDGGGQEALTASVPDTVVHALLGGGELFFFSECPVRAPDGYALLLCRLIRVDDGFLDQVYTLAVEGAADADLIREAVESWNGRHTVLIAFE